MILDLTLIQTWLFIVLIISFKWSCRKILLINFHLKLALHYFIDFSKHNPIRGETDGSINQRVIGQCPLSSNHNGRRWSDHLLSTSSVSRWSIRETAFMLEQINIYSDSQNWIQIKLEFWKSAYRYFVIIGPRVVVPVVVAIQIKVGDKIRLRLYSESVCCWGVYLLLLRKVWSAKLTPRLQPR